MHTSVSDVTIEMNQRDVEVSFVSDTRAKRFTYQTEDPDEDFFELNTGVMFVLPKGTQVFAEYRTLLGHKFFDNYSFSAGLRKEF